jgi:hypothetical protein
MMMRSELFRRSFAGLLVGLSVSVAACSDDALPPQQTAGAAAVGGAAGLSVPVAGAAPGTAGIGTIPSGVGAAGTGVAGTGVAGAGVAGAGVAGVGVAGMGAAGMLAAGSGAAGMAAPTFVPGSPTWSAVFQEIIVGTGCNGGPTCHASTAAGQLKMSMKNDSFMALVGVKAMGVNLVMTTAPACKDTTLIRVVAGDPNASLLYKKVSSATPECGGKMPPSGALAPEKVEQIRLWIMNGAKND